MQGIASERRIRRTAPVALVALLSMLASGVYAESKDGVNWRKPKLGIVEYNGSRENNLVWDLILKSLQMIVHKMLMLLSKTLKNA